MHIKNPIAQTRFYNRTARVLVVAVAVLALSNSGGAMAFGFKYDLVSDINLTLLLDGEPLQGVEVTRKYHWTWGEYSRTRTQSTDSDGKVFFSKESGRAMMAWLPHEPVIPQTLTAAVHGKIYELWYTSKHNYDDLGEVPGRKLNLRCELRDVPRAHPETQTYGICIVEES
ncbi:TPA: hypothetical protein L4R50_000104 [Pseudomonas aeruginosa]|nr:hypothetical protein [Pseudomonas aeruginosa]